MWRDLAISMPLPDLHLQVEQPGPLMQQRRITRYDQRTWPGAPGNLQAEVGTDARRFTRGENDTGQGLHG